MAEALAQKFEIDDDLKLKLNSIVEVLTFNITGKPNGMLGDIGLDNYGTLWFGTASTGHTATLYNDRVLNGKNFGEKFAKELAKIHLPVERHINTSQGWETYDIARFFLDANATDFKERIDAAYEKIKPDLIKVRASFLVEHQGLDQIQETISDLLADTIPADVVTGRALDEAQAKEVITAAYAAINAQAKKLGIRMQAGRIRGEQ